VPAETPSTDTVSVTSLPVARPAPEPRTSPPVVRRHVVAPSPAPTPGPAPAAHGAGAAAEPDCDPPFTIDDNGHKHYKPACLQ
jgi:hypothetical protein